MFNCKQRNYHHQDGPLASCSSYPASYITHIIRPIKMLTSFFVSFDFIMYQIYKFILNPAQTSWYNSSCHTCKL
ncbi:hypothetical protein LguiA_004993 [Lonicera macranthoides]